VAKPYNGFPLAHSAHTMPVKIEKVAVIGAGLMGHGIAQVFAARGLEVFLLDVNVDALRLAISRIRWSLGKLVEKGLITGAEVEGTLRRIHTTTDYIVGLAEADFVLEAVPEKLELKRSVFKSVEKVAPGHAILATNTSSFRVTEIGEATARPERVVGMHWFNPPQLQQLIEVVRGERTSDDAVESTLILARRVGKTPILCRRDVRGFIVNRVLWSVLNDALWAYSRGEAGIREIDGEAKRGGGFPLGWFEVCDLIGLDTVLDVFQSLREAYGDRYRPPTHLLERLIEAGRLGRKTGAGFYPINEEVIKQPRPVGGFKAERSWVVAVNEAARLVEEGVADPPTIDTAMTLGVSWPRGPCQFADEKGLDKVVERLEELAERYKSELYIPCQLLQELASPSYTTSGRVRGLYAYKT